MESLAGSTRSPVDLAVNAGFPVVLNISELRFDPAASRMLTPSRETVATFVSGDVLEVCTCAVLSPSFVKDLEKRAGMLLSLSVGTKDLLEELYSRALSSNNLEFSLSPILETAVNLGASDVHLAVGSVPSVRVNGILKHLTTAPPISQEDMALSINWLLREDAPIEGCLDRDTSLTYMDHRWRVSIYKQRQSMALALRLIPADPPTPEQIGLPKTIVDLASSASGLILFCGPTGSGKSTSMAALINRINRTRSAHILTIEDPIEYIHASMLSVVHQREVGSDTESFATALRSALRQDPDVILVGELRDLDTMRTALSAAETGHLVLATIHANSASSAITRLVSSFPAGEQSIILQQLAGSLKAAVYQVLVPGVSKGRALACEVLVATSGVRSIIRDNRLHELPTALDSSGADTGMMSINKTLAIMVNYGMITSVQAELHASDPVLYKQYLNDTRNYDALTLDPLRDAPLFDSERREH